MTPHILQFLHFADNSQRPDEGEEYDRPWKIRTVFKTLNEAYAEFCNPSEQGNCNFKNRIIFRYTFQRKENISATDNMTATHATVTRFTSRVESLGHKIFMDNFFSSP
jgi:hypothetical protein